MSVAFGAPGPAQGREQVPGYTGLERIGQGRFSVVYRAIQEERGRPVALKVLVLEGLRQVELRRFRRECQLTSRLSGNPHVAAVLEIGTTRSSRPYVAMDYFERGSLAGRLARDGPLPVEEALRAAVEVAEALGAAHAAGIVHRDVRPQNILVSGAGDHALADFGVAALLDDRSQWLSLYHTAPEILQGRPPSPASDVYSLGATLYELLAGLPAYQEGTTAGIAPLLLRINGEGPPPIARRDVPPALVEAIRQAMAARPEERPADATALIGLLHAVQAGLGFAVSDAAPEPAPAWREAPTPPPAAPEPVEDADGEPDWPGPAAPPDWDDEYESPPWAAPGDSQRVRRVLAVAAAVAVAGVLGGLIIHAALVSTPGGAPGSTPTPAAASARPSTSSTASSAPPPASVLDAARPTDLTAADQSTSVQLHWRLSAGNDYPLFVQKSSATGVPSAPTPVPNGSTSTTVTGLDAHAGYCFQVGAVVAFGQPSTVAWSAPACIRGATVRPTASR